MKTMKSQKSPLRAAIEEIDKAADLVSVWLILRYGEIAGRITARSGKNNVLHVAFALYANNTCNTGLFGYRRMTGAGYPKIDEGVADILREYKTLLNTKYSITLRPSSFPDFWRRDFEDCGYSLLRAL